MIVALALGNGMPKDIPLEEIDNYKKIIDKQPIIFISNHSKRQVTIKSEDGPDTFMHDPNSDRSVGWNIYKLRKKGGPSRISISSLTTGSKISAIRCPNDDWLLCLEVPFIEEEPCQGYYWDIFHKAHNKNLLV